MMYDVLNKIKRKWMKMRLQPIRVLCFHQVSEKFDENKMYEQDWISTSDFTGIVRRFQEKGYTFISIAEAFDKLRRDTFRCKKYAVLTADDGWASLKNILPWINEQHIPITLFLNPAFFDGKHYRIKEGEEYLTAEEVNQLSEQYPLLTIGSHGWEHVSAPQLTAEEFNENVDKSVEALSKLPNYIPYFAYTWGWHTIETDRMLIKKDMVIVNMKGRKNYQSHYAIDREELNNEIEI